MNEEKTTVTLEDLLQKFNKQNKNFINDIEKEESMERIETFQAVENDIKGQKFQTDIFKDKFVNEIKGGLGKKLKANPNTIVIIKKPWYNKLKDFIKKIFTTF